MRTSVSLPGTSSITWYSCHWPSWIMVNCGASSGRRPGEAVLVQKIWPGPDVLLRARRPTASLPPGTSTLRWKYGSVPAHSTFSTPPATDSRHWCSAAQPSGPWSKSQRAVPAGIIAGGIGLI